MMKRELCDLLHSISQIPGKLFDIFYIFLSSIIIERLIKNRGMLI